MTILSKGVIYLQSEALGCQIFRPQQQLYGKAKASFGQMFFGAAPLS